MKKLLLLLLSTNLFACKEETIEESTTKLYCPKSKCVTVKYHKKVVRPDYFFEINKTSKECVK